jgi:hypothetical protein
VRVAVGRIEGVESVEVSLQRAVAEIRLSPGNRVTVARLRQVIKDNGFTSKEATVTAIGTIAERGGKPALAVSALDQVWLLTPDTASPEAYRAATERLATRQTGSVEAVGVLAPPAPNQPETLTLRTLK